jgi:pentatricopeptide repeat protein
MKISGFKPDRFVLSIVLSACTRTRNLSMGQALHSYINESGLSLDTHLQNSLIIMYSSCGHMKLAESIYNNSMSPNMVASTSMIFGYAKFGQIETAHRIFDNMPEKDLVSWSALISGYAESNRPDKALDLFKQMQSCGVRPDEVTMLSLISACSNLGALDPAKQVHVYVKNHGLDRILSVTNALIDMFAKCGSLDDAWKVFEQVPRKNIITWTSMITGFAMHGDGKSALALFDRMKDENRIKPNHITFVSLLYACSHAGLVKEGQSLFESMVRDYNIEPTQEHYGCMVDLYGRSKLLKEAVELIETMPFQPNVVVWGSLLGACRIHGEVELGELAAKRVLELDPNHDGAYVLLSNIYAKAGRSDDVRKVRENMKFRGLSKEKGYSWLELNGTVHAFLTQDNSHPQTTEIYEKLREIVTDVETIGYSPDAGCALIDSDEEEKKEAVLFHSEKLALTFGLVNSKRGECVRISKNIRICEDCHMFVKFVSRVYHREIVLRDRTRFHHFRDGICSCGDFW